MAVWTVKGGRQGEHEARLLEHGVLGGGWESVPDLTAVDSRDELAKLYTDAYPGGRPRSIVANVAQLWSLVHRMQVDDLVVLPLKTTKVIAVGRVSSSYRYRTDLGPTLRHVRPVSWIRTDVPREAFNRDLLTSFGAFLTIGEVRRDKADERVLAALEIGAA